MAAHTCSKGIRLCDLKREMIIFLIEDIGVDDGCKRMAYRRRVGDDFINEKSDEKRKKYLGDL